MLSRLNRYTDFNDIWYGDFIIFKGGHRLIFTTKTDFDGGLKIHKFILDINLIVFINNTYVIITIVSIIECISTSSFKY